MKSLGERLKEARQAKGWSQTYVCDQLRISNSRLSGYERNYREPDTKMLTTLASLYHVSTDWLMGATELPAPQQSNHSHPRLQDPELQKWYEALPQSNEENLSKLKKIWDIITSDE
ncbi:helix-turn-helix domain-containing protein [Halobacillus sp. B23F22_1]|uniref:helix-turn-helix domain-containing protein n=1 Tax=Halobacillus sp. B23F22_1 TaxID=3459514 RepID=UPI00373E5E89